MSLYTWNSFCIESAYSKYNTSNPRELQLLIKEDYNEEISILEITNFFDKWIANMEHKTLKLKDIFND